MSLNPLGPGFAAAAVFAGAAFAAAQAGPARDAVSVDISGLAAAMAQRMNLDESKMPLSLMVSAEVASEACAVPIHRITPAGCEATVPTGALDRLLAARMEANAPLPEPPSRPAQP